MPLELVPSAAPLFDAVPENTIRSWISVLEASYLCFVIPAWHQSQRKRWVKAPKLHWFDSGLVCHLLGIEYDRQLMTLPLRGAIFESWVASEIWKSHTSRGIVPHLVHFRETRGCEVDLGVVRGRAMTLVEVKSGATVNADYFASLRAIREELASGGQFDDIAAAVVYGGDETQRRGDAAVMPWSGIAGRDWTRSRKA